MVTIKFILKSVVFYFTWESFEFRPSFCSQSSWLLICHSHWRLPYADFEDHRWHHEFRDWDNTIRTQYQHQRTPHIALWLVVLGKSWQILSVGQTIKSLNFFFLELKFSIVIILPSPLKNHILVPKSYYPITAPNSYFFAQSASNQSMLFLKCIHSQFVCRPIEILSN